MNVLCYSRHFQALEEMKIGAREPDGTCETCHKRSAWAERWQKPNSISIPLSWMGAWIMPVVFLTLVYDQGRGRSGRFPRNLINPILQTRPINLVKAASESLQRAVLEINWIKGGMVNLLAFAYCMTGLTFALASRPAVRSSRRSKSWFSMSCPELWLKRASALAFEDGRIKDLAYAPWFASHAQVLHSGWLCSPPRYEWFRVGRVSVRVFKLLCLRIRKKWN